MNKLFNRHSFIVQLVTGFVALILLTTLMAGVPAYWLTRVQLEKQAWLNVENARRSTLSLLQAEADRLADQTTLLAERPTLQRLVREQNRPDAHRLAVQTADRSEGFCGFASK